MKPKRNFYSLSYPRAMQVAMAVASLGGKTDWDLYRSWINRYEQINGKRPAVRFGTTPARQDIQSAGSRKSHPFSKRQLELAL